MGVYMEGMLTCELVSADLERTMNEILGAGIRLKDVEAVDLLTVRFTVPRSARKRMEAIAARHGDRIRILRRSGAVYQMEKLLKRPVLLGGIALIFAAMLVIPGRICFVRVEGNTRVPSRQICEQASACGISFWSSRRAVRSEQVKNALLGAIPELSWVGVNTKGCVAVISVRERSIEEEQEAKPPVSSIVAARDGIIRSMTVTKGSALCKTGQAVKAGEVLISGYSDLGIALRVSNAEGEVYADTVRDLTVQIPTDHNLRGGETAVEEKYTLIIGKKRINLSQSSGIFDTGCDKMTVTEYLTLPGGFQLPVALEREVYTFYEDSQTALLQEDATRTLLDFARGYLTQQMVAGQITDQTLSWEEQEDCYRLSGRFRCREMIGQLRAEEIVK